MKFTVKLTLLSVVLGGALYWSNPTSADFSAFLSEHVQQELADDVPGETALGQKLRKGLGQIAAAAGEQLAHRQEWHVACVYTIDIAGESHVFLGVAGQFFPITAH